MTLSNSAVDRGKIGNTPALMSRADETFCDFMRDARNMLLQEPFKKINARAVAAFKADGVALAHTPDSIAGIRRTVLHEPELATWLRVKRSAQEVYKQRIIDSYNTQSAEFLRKLAEAETRGPGTLTLDKDFVAPACAAVEIHIQPGGYVGLPLAGLYYDYGTSVFFGDGGVADGLQKKLAGKTATPKDGKVSRILDVGCSLGQLACELKRKFPDAEVHGIDIAAPMLRYAHWRTVEQNLAVHYTQMPCEEMTFESASFDLVSSHLLFHEIPLPVIKRTLAEIRRVLRPGGTYVMWDFPSATATNPGYAGFAGLMDAADNCEPYAPGFVTCGIEKLLEDAGLKLRSAIDDNTAIAETGRVCDAI